MEGWGARFCLFLKLFGLFWRCCPCAVSIRAFFWLVSLLLSSLVWFIAVQISNKDSGSQQKGLLVFGVLLSVLLQELFRFAYYKLLKWEWSETPTHASLAREKTDGGKSRVVACVFNITFIWCDLQESKWRTAGHQPGGHDAHLCSPAGLRYCSSLTLSRETLPV